MKIKHIILNLEEKTFLKEKILEASQILRKWKKVFPSMKIREIKSAFLKNQPFTNDPQWIKDQSVLSEFQNKEVSLFGETLEMTVLRSFMGACIKLAKKVSYRVEAQLGIKDSSVYEDLLQDAIQVVLHSMYYYSRADIELNTFIFNSLKKELNRQVKYKYCFTSPIREKDNLAKMSLFNFIEKNPDKTWNQILEFMEKEHGIRESEVNDLLRTVVREKKENNAVLEINSKLEDFNYPDVVSIFEKSLCFLTKKEAKVVKFGFQSNFERGWKSRCAEKLMEDGEGCTRQNVNIIFNSALKKIRPHFDQAC